MGQPLRPSSWRSPRIVLRAGPAAPCSYRRHLERERAAVSLWWGTSSATGPSRHQTRAAPQGPGVTRHSQMATSSQEFVCIIRRGKKVRKEGQKEDLTSWCNCSFPSPGVKISESNFILTAQLERLCFLVISQQQFLP